MRLNKRLINLFAILLFAITTLSNNTFAQQSSGSLRGQVLDELKGAIVGATVTIVDQNNNEKTAITNDQGIYQFNNLLPGKYTLRTIATGFTLYETTELQITVNHRETLNITLKPGLEEENVTVASESGLNTEPDNNLTATILRGSDLDALPDDPEELQEALRALAGPAAGPNGGQIYIDGFTNGRFPPKDTIREIRINSSPFSAEYDQMGHGRIEIFTRPGTDRFRGQTSFRFSDESLNSRHPLVPNRPSYQRRNFSADVSGPIIRKKSSFFFDFDKGDTDDNDIINARILDPSLNIVPFHLAVLTPQRRLSFSPRIDYQIAPLHTLVGRYTYNRSTNEKSGIGDFNLLSRAYDTVSTQHSFQLTETSTINKSIVNETRFQFTHDRREQRGDNTIPTIRVLDAFTGGGAQVGLSSNEDQRWELHNNTIWSLGKHSFKAGARLRYAKIVDISPQNFGGTITFAGGSAPELNANNEKILDSTVLLTSIEHYQRTRRLQQAGFSPSEIREYGGGPTQFSISGGNPETRVSQWDISPFIQDDWRVRNNLTLSFGLRYERQNNIDSKLNFAPRIGIAWSPTTNNNSSAHQRRTVVRAGFGIFYDRINESLTMQTIRYNGINQRNYVTTDPTILDRIEFNADGTVRQLPSVESLNDFLVPQTVRMMAPDIQSPYTMQALASVERELPYNFNFYVSISSFRTLHLLRSRNINAPLNGIRPLGDIGNVYQYESTGRLNQNQFGIGISNRLSRRFSVSAWYAFNRANSDTDGGGTFPANQYDLSNEYGRVGWVAPHTFTLYGNISAPLGISLTPIMTFSSGTPFNITIGRDINRDTLFTERPAFATDLNKPGIVFTKYGVFDPNPTPDQEIIPRNYGTGPSFFTTSMRISKSFGFGKVPSRDTANQDPNNQENRGEGRRGGRGGGRGGFGGGRGGMRGVGRGGRGGGGGSSDGASETRYRITLSVNIQNLLNSTNLGSPVGNLSSPFFGQSTSTRRGFGFGGGGPDAGNRTVQAQIRFSF
jgi:hypothetical protein